MTAQVVSLFLGEKDGKKRKAVLDISSDPATPETHPGLIMSTHHADGFHVNVSIVEEEPQVP